MGHDSKLEENPPHQTLLLLGPFLLERDGHPVKLSRKTRALLAWLTVTEEPVARQRLLDIFCEGSQDPGRTLRWHLSALRRALGSDALVSRGSAVAIDRDYITVDCWQFDDSSAADETLSLYRGEFLEGISLPDSPAFELWLIGIRSHYRQRFQRLGEEALERLIERGDLGAAVHLCQQLLAVDSLFESFHGRLMWLYAASGQTAAALAQFEHCCQLLQDELGMNPSAEIEALADAIRRGEVTPQPVYTAPPAVDLSTANLIGRSADLEALHGSWQRSRPGVPGLVLISAEAGCGKTALVEAFLAQTSNAAVLRATCYESTRDLPYQPWLQIVGRRWTALTGGTQRVEQLLLAVADDLLDRESLVLFLDDLHQADEDSLRLFNYILLRAAALPIRLMAIGTFRPEEVAENRALNKILPDLAGRPHSQTIHLDGFSPAEIGLLVGQTGTDADAKRIEQLHQATGGNPLFLTEILRELPADGTLPLPPGLQILVRRRLEKLPDQRRRPLEFLAVFDSKLSLATLQRIAEEKAGPVAAALEWGMRYGLVILNESDTPSTVDIRHDLLREAILQTLSPLRRRSHHAQIAQILARQDVGKDALLIMHHAQKGEAYYLVLDIALIAARQAEARHSLPQAAAALEAYGQAYEMLDADQRREREAEHLDVLLEYARILGVTGLFHASHEGLLGEIANLLIQHSTDDRKTNYLIALAQWQSAQGRLDAALGAIEQAFQLNHQRGHQKEAARVLLTRSAIETAHGRNRSGLASALTAEKRFGALHDQEGLWHARQALAVARMNLGHISDMIDLLEINLVEARAQNDLIGLGNTHMRLAIGWLYFYAGHKALEHAKSARRLHAETGRTAGYAVSTLMLAHSHEMLEEQNRASELAREALHLARRIEDRWCEAWAERALMRYAYRAGEFDEAEAILRRLLPASRQTLTQNHVLDLAWLGRVCLRQGKLDKAFEYSTRAFDLLEDKTDDYYVFAQPHIVFMHGEILLASGDRQGANQAIHRAYAEMQHFAGQIHDPETRVEFLAASQQQEIIQAYANISNTKG